MEGGGAMERVRQKLESQRGASITFALLLFLVCAVVSSVVIVAGTAAAGRMSQIAEMDQRYYAVTSAAELLKDALDGNAVTVEKTTVTQVTLDQDGNPVETGGEASDPSEGETEPTGPEVRLFNGTEVDEAQIITFTDADSLPLMAHAAYYIETYRDDPGKWPFGRTLTLTVSGSGVGEATADALKVTLLEQLESNGIMTLYVTKPGKTNQAYTLKLTFKADVTDNSYVSTDRGTPKNVKTVGGKTTYTVDETRTTREVTTLKWTLTGIVKSAVPATSEGLGG